MAISKVTGPTIRGIVSLVPNGIEDNLTDPYLSYLDQEALVNATGIRFRRKVSCTDLSIKVLFEKGIQRLLNELNWDVKSIDVLICVTQTAKVAIPSIACQLHGDMGFSKSVIAYDINSGCSGFVYGLHTVSHLLSSIDKPNSRALLCCGDISSSITNPEDLSVRPIFSDAGSVTAIEFNIEDRNTSFFNLETIGEGQKAIYTEKTEHTNWMKLDGIDVFNYSASFVPKNITHLLEHTNFSITEIDWFVFHQANKLINETIRKALVIDIEKVPSSLYDYGNTASASIPLTITTELSSKLKSGWVLLSGFGVGFSIATALVKLDAVKVCIPVVTDL